MAVKNITGSNDAVTYDNTTPYNVTYQGGGFDFTNYSGSASFRGIEIPTAALQAMVGTSSWLFCAYLKLPTTANWNSTTSIYSMITLGDGAYNVAPNATYFLIAQQTSNVLNTRFITNQTTPVSLNFTLDPTTEQGQVAQIAVWKIGTALFMRIKTALNGASGRTTSNSSGTWTGQPLSLVGKTIKFGSAAGFNGGAGSRIGLRYYRIAIEDLVASGRTPATVLDYDWSKASVRFS
jgi:hypothetical protein